MKTKDQPKIGVGVMVIRNKKILLGQRKNSHGDKTWSFPGGHLELNEKIKDCAIRETKEETGLKITNIKLATFTNDIFKKEGKHYVTLFVVAHAKSGQPKVMEPDKCEKWGWFEWNNLPKPLFLPIKNLLKQRYNPLKHLNNYKDNL